MATPEDYRRDAAYRFASARGIEAGRALVPVSAAREVVVAEAPTGEAGPEDDTTGPISGMFSRNGDFGWAGDGWLKAITPNPDTILQRSGADGLKAYDALLDDPTAFQALQQRRLAITSRDWEVAPGDENDPRSVKAADEFRAMLKAVGFDRVTGMLHYAVWYGYAVGEALWGTKEYDGRLIVWLDDIVIPDRRWFGFNMEGALRAVDSLTRSIEGDELPPNKFITVRTGGSHDFAFYGLGLAHWCWWLVFFKVGAIRNWSIYLEKLGMPTVAIEFNATDTNEQKDARLQAAVSVGQDRAVRVPEGTLQNGQMQLLEATRGGATGSGYSEFVTAQDDAINRVVLGQSGTSKAQPSGLNSNQADVHADVKAELVKADADLISETINRTVARWVTRWNHGPDVAPPTVYRVLDDAEDLNTVAERDTKLDGIGIRRSEQSIRDVYGDGYEVDRISEAEKAAQAERIATAKAQPVPGQPAANDNGSARVAARRAEFGIDDEAPLYVRRDALPETQRALLAWAKDQGIATTVPAAALHVTVLYSKQAVDWFALGEDWYSNQDGHLIVKEGGPRAVAQLGDEGAVVLRFASADLSYRHAGMIERGASSDYPEYKPHVTISYDAGGVDLSKVEPFTGELRFGPEIFEPIKAGGFDPATLDFSADGQEDAIERLVDALCEEGNPVFSAMAGELRNALQGVRSVEAARVALLDAMERMPVDRLARLTALPLLAERAGALAGAEDQVTA